MYCCYHDKKQIDEFNLKETECFKPFYAADCPYNKFINEMSMYKWIADNDKDSEVIGTCHYGRRFNPIVDKISDKIDDETCIAFQKDRQCNQTFTIHAVQGIFMSTAIHLVYVDYLKQKYGDDKAKEILLTDTGFYDSDTETYHEHKRIVTYSKNSIIMSRNKFMELVDFVYGFIDYFIKRFNIKSDDDFRNIIDTVWYDNILPWEYQHMWWWDMGNRKNESRYRIIGYYCELLTSVFIKTHFKKENIIVNNIYE